MLYCRRRTGTLLLPPCGQLKLPKCAHSTNQIQMRWQLPMWWGENSSTIRAKASLKRALALSARWNCLIRWNFKVKEVKKKAPRHTHKVPPVLCRQPPLKSGASQNEFIRNKPFFFFALMQKKNYEDWGEERKTESGENLVLNCSIMWHTKSFLSFIVRTLIYI